MSTSITKILGCAALTALSLPAQTLSPVLGTADVPPAFFGVAAIHDIEVEHLSPGKLMMFLAARRPGATHLDLVAGILDTQAGSFSEVSGLGLGNFNTPADESSVTVTDDLLHLIYDTPSGSVLVSRRDIADPFGNPRSLTALPGQPTNPCFVSNKLLAYRGGGDIWITEIDLKTQAGVTNPGTAMVDDSDIVLASGFAIPDWVGGGGGGGGGGGNGGTYTSTYTYRRNGSVKKCTQQCIENPGVVTTQALSQEATYYQGPPSTGGCVLDGTHFFADSATGGIHLAHFVSTLSVVIPSNGTGSVELPIHTPVEGLPNAGTDDQLFLLAGVNFRVPLTLHAFVGQLAVFPLVTVPVATDMATPSVSISFSAGLTPGARIDIQPLRIDQSTPELALGGSGSLIVK